MSAFLKFLGGNPLFAVLFAISALSGGLGYLQQGYEIWKGGLEGWQLQALGWAGLLIALLVLLFRWESERGSDGDVQTSSTRKVVEDATQSGGVRLGQPVAFNDPISSALFITRIEFDTQKLADDLQVRFLLQVVNGSVSKLDIERPEGTLAVRKFKSDADFIDLPRLAVSETNQYVPPYSEQFIEYEQRIPGQLSQDMLDWIKSDGIEVNLKRISFLVVGDEPPRKIKLPSWAGIRVFWRDPYIHTGRIIEANLSATVGVGVGSS